MLATCLRLLLRLQTTEPIGDGPQLSEKMDFNFPYIALEFGRIIGIADIEISDANSVTLRILNSKMLHIHWHPEEGKVIATVWLMPMSSECAAETYRILLSENLKVLRNRGAFLAIDDECNQLLLVYCLDPIQIDRAEKLHEHTEHLIALTEHYIHLIEDKKYAQPDSRHLSDMNPSPWGGAEKYVANNW